VLGIGLPFGKYIMKKIPITISVEYFEDPKGTSIITSLVKDYDGYYTVENKDNSERFIFESSDPQIVNISGSIRVSRHGDIWSFASDESLHKFNLAFRDALIRAEI
jgi:hypothetical protein